MKWEITILCDIKRALASDAILSIAVEQKNILIGPDITVISVIGQNLCAIERTEVSLELIVQSNKAT